MASAAAKGKSKSTLSERFANYYGNLRSLVLGDDLTGRRQTCQENPFTTETDTQLTGFKKDKEELSLKPVRVDLSRTSNRDAHHTSQYEVPNLIIRRGQQLDVNIEFQRNFVRESDAITLKFVTGSRPTQSRGSVVPVRRVDSLQDGQWGYQLVAVQEKTVTLRMCSAADAIVGRYELFIDTVYRGQDGEERWRHKHPDDIFIIFNPWFHGDSVYIKDEVERQEYVLNETGRIWIGAVDKHYVRPWNFGQFEYVCLIAAISLVDKSELADRAKANALLVTRAINRAINHTEREGGVVHANWSGKYEDGVAPYAWTGSPAILEEFLKRRKGVKYGHCWVMSAVATTLLRALGIPSRCVTCYKAVHDGDFGGAVNTHWSSDLTPKTSLDDGIWDFHVWNEAYFKRPDLPEGYDGWQAFDPTPMDCCEGAFTSGPASVKALKEGDLHLGFEAKFIFAELHGNRVHWDVNSEGDMEPFGLESSVGKVISTKAAGTISRTDLTASYKQPEGSSELDEVLTRASKMCRRYVPDIVSCPEEDVDFSITDGDKSNGDLNVVLMIRNKSSAPRVIDVYLGGVAAYYTGVTSTHLNEQKTSIVVKPESDSEAVLNIKGTDYINTIDTDAHVNVYAAAHVRETGQRFARVESHWVDKPHLEVKSEGRAVVDQAFTVVVKVVNSMAVPLTDGVISVDGPGFARVTGIQLKKPVAPGEEVRETVSLKARRAGLKEVVAVFHCRQVCDVGAASEVDVKPDDK